MRSYERFARVGALVIGIVLSNGAPSLADADIATPQASYRLVERLKESRGL